MSNIEKSDVKNHLSPRFRTQIHLCPPQSQPDATGFSNEEMTGAEPKASNSTKDLLNRSSTNGRKPIAPVSPNGNGV
jgi:hypothetical protein